MYQKIQTIYIQGKPVKCIQEGEGPIHCLFIGPGSLYLPTIPDDAKKQLFTFYDVDRYFAYPLVEGNRVTLAEIESLTLNDFIAYYEAVYAALALDKIAVFGPSALGLVAHEYAQRHPDTISHVFMLGTPFSTKDLLQKQAFFMQGNYSPLHYPQFTTEWSANKWNRFQQAQEKYNKLVADELTPDENLIQELVADQEKYSIQPESEDVLRDRWQRFNTTMRNHFFRTMITDYEMKGEVRVPTLAILGLFDGVAPYYGLVDKIQQEKSIYGKIDYVILEDAAHSPQLESSHFSRTIAQWLKDNPSDQSNIQRTI
jgi:pimeloyl-ACP methyl ester carboxylesterase